MLLSSNTLECVVMMSLLLHVWEGTRLEHKLLLGQKTCSLIISVALILCFHIILSICIMTIQQYGSVIEFHFNMPTWKSTDGEHWASIKVISWAWPDDISCIFFFFFWPYPYTWSTLYICIVLLCFIFTGWLDFIGLTQDSSLVSVHL